MIPPHYWVLALFAVAPVTAAPSAPTESDPSAEVQAIEPACSGAGYERTEAEPCLGPSVMERYAPLEFGELFLTPAGQNGLEYTGKARGLEGQLVRITGYMVRTVNEDPDMFMFTPFPVATLTGEYGIADQVPPNVIHAILPHREGLGSAWQPYVITVYGRLELGTRQEADGRVSSVRLRVDQLTVGQDRRPIDVQRPLSERAIHLGPHDHPH